MHPGSIMKAKDEIVEVMEKILKDILSEKFPVATVTEVGGKIRTLSSKNTKTRRSFAIHVRLLVYILGLIKDGKRVTKREVFYQFESLFKTQATLDDALDRVARTLAVPRRELRIDAAGKGLYFGSISLQGDVACQTIEKARTIPTDTFEIERAEGFVLVVEKEAIFQRILEDYQDHLQASLGPFIVITGKGYPCMATRRLVAVLGERWKLPVMVLVDFDPYGFEIALQYKIGSKRLPDDIDELKCPNIQFLGISRSDLDAHGAHFDTFPLTEADRKRILKLKSSVTDLGWTSIAKELAFMLDHDCKAEIESIKMADDPHYFTRTFLVTKIRNLLSIDS